ncbi:MAG TPA: toprim domain-containing protein [Sideroxyarcus sp.]|nr:toprim domain-containing protein [Sideroxyarcus sp.]
MSDTVSAAQSAFNEVMGIADAQSRSRIQLRADRCRELAAKALEPILERGIHEDVIKRAIKGGAIGFDDWTSDTKPEGEQGHGGEAITFISRTFNPGHAVAIDKVYVDPARNGGVAFSSEGEDTHGWTSDIKRLTTAHKVYVVGTPFNALAVECCDLKGAAVFATRTPEAVAAIDWNFCRGKKVMICMDNTPPDENGYRPGLKQAWAVHERLTSLDISALIIDQASWLDENEDPIISVNDYLRIKGAEKLKQAMWKIEDWLIPGQPGKVEDGFGKQRVYLPYHDDIKYWRFRVREDFTSYVTEKTDPESKEVRIEYSELCGFRVAAVSRVTIASATSTMTGDAESQPKTLFAVSVQTPRHGAQLVRRVVEDEKLHNVETWKKIGPVFNQAAFLRMVNILERAADIGARNAANFVGLCYRDGKLIVNEGPDCYFTNPDQQCPYHNLSFPTGTVADAKRVIEAYQYTFKKNAAMLPLVWGLGGHLKALLGFWPHMMMQADKGQGKSTLIKRLERTLGFTMFSGQSLQTEFRLLTSISHTSHPVGWEELSARRQDIIDKAVGILQENYQYTVNRRGADMTEFLLSAPVLLAGEDVPVRSLIGKIIRTELTGKKGPIMPDDLPRFPVKQWLEFLTTLKRGNVLESYARHRDYCLERSLASGEDDGAVRMASNYAAVLTCWRYLCEFAGIESTQGDFTRDLIEEMNRHIKETSADREPWVWIVETLLSEISAHRYQHPYKWDMIDGEECLLIRTGHAMDHLSTTPALREKWNGLPVKSDRVFKKQMMQAGVLVTSDDGVPLDIERSIGPQLSQRRIGHLTAISLPRLADYGLYATPSTDITND